MEEINKTIDAAKFNLKLNSEKPGPLDFLSHYGLYQNGNFTNAAVLLFAKNPARFIPQARVRIALLKAGKTGDEFTDDRLLDGNLFKNRISILDFFDKHLQLKRKFDNKNWARDDDYEIPMKALREGIMNALVHREYSVPSSAMAVIIYHDKIEISNSGKSPYKQNELTKSHLSMPYNPDIAHIVFLRGFIEKIGRGTIMIADECKKAGLKAPVWDIGDQTVKLTFYSKTQLGGAVDGAADGAIEKDNDGAIDGAIDGTTKGVKEKLSRLLKTIAADEGKRAPDYIKALGVSERTLERYLQQLKEADLIEFKGEAAQTGGYYLTKRIKAQIK